MLSRWGSVAPQEASSGVSTSSTSRSRKKARIASMNWARRRSMASDALGRHSGLFTGKTRKDEARLERDGQQTRQRPLALGAAHVFAGAGIDFDHFAGDDEQRHADHGAG